MQKLIKLANRNQRELEGTLLKSYYTEVLGRALLRSLDSSIYPSSVPYNTERQAERYKYHFWVFGMTRLGIEPRSLGPVANSNHYANQKKTFCSDNILLTNGSTTQRVHYIYIYIYIYIEIWGKLEKSNT